MARQTNSACIGPPSPAQRDEWKADVERLQSTGTWTKVSDRVVCEGALYHYVFSCIPSLFFHCLLFRLLPLLSYCFSPPHGLLFTVIPGCTVTSHVIPFCPLSSQFIVFGCLLLNRVKYATTTKIQYAYGKPCFLV